MTEFKLLSPGLGEPGEICENLRSAVEGLEPVGSPEEIAMPQGWRPVGVINAAEANLTVIRTDSKLAALRRGSAFGELEFCDGFEASLLSDKIMVNSNSEAFCVTFDDAQGVLKATATGGNQKDAFVAFAFGDEVEYITVKVPAIRISDSYSKQGTLSDSDLAKIKAATIQFWEDLDSSCRKNGCFCRPVILKAALFSAGEVVYVSQPQALVFNSTLAQNRTLRFTLHPSDSTLLMEQSLQVRVFRVVCRHNSAGADRLKILATPPIWDADPNGRISVEMRSRADQQWLCAASLPSTPWAAAPGALTRVAVNNSEMFETLFHGEIPSQGQAPNLMLAAGSIEDDIDSWYRALDRKGADNKNQLTAASISASLMSATTDAVCLAGITAGRCTVADINEFVLTRASTPDHWHGYVKVEFADGSCRVSQHAATEGMPLLFKPVLSYPAPDAVSIEIGVMSPTAGTRIARFAMTPDLDSVFGVFATSQLTAISLPKTSAPFEIPAEKILTTAQPGLVGVSLPDKPLDIKAFSRFAGNIIAIMPALGSQNTWDFGRSRFYVFTTSGVFSVNADPRRSTLSSAKIADFAIENPREACATDIGVAVINGSRILMLQGSKVTEIARVKVAQALIWCADDRELWCLTPQGVTAICFDHKYGKYSMPVAIIPETAANNSFVKSAQGPWITARHSAAPGFVAVAWGGYMSLKLKRPGAGLKMRRLTLDVSGEFESLQLGMLRNHYTTSAPAPEAFLDLSGMVKSPITRLTPIPAAAKRFYVVMRGLAKANSRFLAIDIQ